MLDTLIDPAIVKRLSPGGTLMPTMASDRTVPVLLPARGLAAESLEMGAVIGRGGMGVIREARQVSLGRTVAVKSVREDRNQERYEHLLFQEAWITGNLEHPNIVPVYALGNDEGKRPAFVMRLLDGVSWSSVIADPDTYVRLLQGRTLLDLHLDTMMAVCRAVHFAHTRGILHRDLKPDNVVIGEFGEVYVLDWGLAVALRDDAGPVPLAADIREVEGSPSYMAPEMAWSVGADIGVETDVFQLGATLFHAVTGRAPYEGPSIYEILELARACERAPCPSEVDEELAGIIDCAMARQPEDRFSSVESLRLALVKYRAHGTSRTLCQQAKPPLAAVWGGDISDPVDIREQAALARFALQESLRIWPENRRAGLLLEQLVGSMVDHSLRWGELDGAREWLRLLAEPPESILETISSRERELAQREEHYVFLTRQWDLSESAHARAILSVLIAVYPTIGGLLLAVAGSSGLWAPPGWSVLALMLTNLPFFLAGQWLALQVSSTRANQLQVRLSVVGGLGQSAVLGIVPIVGMNVDHAMVLLFLYTATFTGMLGVAGAEGLMVASMTSLLGAAAVLALPGSAWWVYFWINAVGYTLVALSWAKKRRESAVEEQVGG